MRRASSALFLLLFVLARASHGAPTINCHCFKEREFDPGRPSAADPYILANARNSLLSAAFGLAKSAVVRARMSGTPAEDLWISHWVASRTGADRERLVEAKEAKGSWRAALSGAALEPSKVGASFAAQARAGASAEALAAEAACEVLAQAWGAGREELRGLRSKGAEIGELVVAVIIGKRLGSPPSAVLSDVQGGRKTWGTALQAAGLEPSGIEAEVRKMFPAGAR
jgi:hypothetical protein